MIDPAKTLVLTPLNAQNDENILELDIELVTGWMGFPTGAIIYINGPLEHSAFSVKETVEEIKEQINKLR